MGWWTSLVDGTNYVRKGLVTLSSGISSGAKWLWNNASLKKASIATVTYGANAFYYSAKQLTALRKSSSTLINNENSRKIANGLYDIVIYDVMPLVAINTINNGVQNYFRDGHPEDAPWLAPYSIFLSSLALANYAVKYYTWRQGIPASIRMFILMVYGSAAFNSNKKITPESLCTELDCNTKRLIKGMGREPIILAANEALAWGVSFIPYIGPTGSRIMKILFNGRYITRAVTPERCERHKAMVQESVLALGLSYELSCILMEQLFEYTVGLPPFLCHRILRQVVLLLHINNAAHMKIPLAKPGEQTLWIDPLDAYEWICRFIADVIFAGLMKRIPIDFKRPKDAPPLIPLSPALQFVTKILNSDLEKEESKKEALHSSSSELTVQPVNNRELAALPVNPPKPWVLPKQLVRFEGLVNDPINTFKPWLLPPMFRGTHELLNDPIISKYWKELRKGGILTIDFIKSYGQSNTAATLAWAPKSIAAALYWKFGVPKKVTRVILMLTQEDDFWALANALKAWFERHKIKFNVKLANTEQVLLSGEKRIAALPQVTNSIPPVLAKDIKNERRTSTSPVPVIQATAIKSTRELPSMKAINASDFMTTRKRVNGAKPGSQTTSSQQDSVVKCTL